MPKLKKQSTEIRRQKKKERLKIIKGQISEADIDKTSGLQHKTDQNSPRFEELQLVKQSQECHDLVEQLSNPPEKRKKSNECITQLLFTPYRERLRLRKRAIVITSQIQSDDSNNENSTPQLGFKAPTNYLKFIGKKNGKRRDLSNQYKRLKECRRNQSVKINQVVGEDLSQGNSRRECQTKFMTAIKEGPTYICSCCGGLWFRTSVKPVDKNKLRSDGLNSAYIDQVEMIR
jgi:hypothetical protein